MTPRRLWFFFAGALLMLLLVTLPLRLAVGGLEERGFSARRVSGSIWNGRLDELAYSGAPLGDAQVGLQALPVLAGMRRLNVELLDGPATGRAVLVTGGDSAGFTDADGRLQAAMLPLPVPLAGEIVLEDAAVLFEDGACRHAQGRVTTDVLRRSAARLQWSGPELSGELACQGAAVVAPLTGQDGATRVDATVRFEGDGRYRLATRVLTPDVGLGAVLLLGGFQRGPEGLSRVDEGRYRQ